MKYELVEYAGWRRFFTAIYWKMQWRRTINGQPPLNIISTFVIEVEESMMELYIVGKWIAGATEGVVWDFQGVFDKKEAAENHCMDDNGNFKESWFIGPAKLNSTEIPDETRPWPRCYYPGCSHELKN